MTCESVNDKDYLPLGWLQPGVVQLHATPSKPINFVTRCFVISSLSSASFASTHPSSGMFLRTSLLRFEHLETVASILPCLPSSNETHQAVDYTVE